MPSFTVKVPNGDDGEDLGLYEADYLPRVGDKFFLFDPRLTGGSDQPFEAEVSAVYWEAMHKKHKYATDTNKNVAEATVWLAEFGAIPKLYCDCSESQREHFGVDTDGLCVCCGHARR